MKKKTKGRRIQYEANCRKTFSSVLGHFLEREFPKTFGPITQQIFVDHVNALFEEFHRPRERLQPGQTLWLAVAKDDFPSREKSMEKTRLVPVVLDLVTPEDIAEMVRGQPLAIRNRTMVRLFEQAYAQGGVLSCSDVGLLLYVSSSLVSKVIAAHEAKTQTVIPRRGTIHDLGRSVTHKRIICYKRLVEKKPTSQVAAETLHCEEEVEYYVQCFRRIHLCQSQRMTMEDTARATGFSVHLVKEYFALIEEFGLPPLPNTEGK